MCIQLKWYGLSKIGLQMLEIAIFFTMFYLISCHTLMHFLKINKYQGFVKDIYSVVGNILFFNFFFFSLFLHFLIIIIIRHNIGIIVFAFEYHPLTNFFKYGISIFSNQWFSWKNNFLFVLHFFTEVLSQWHL